MKKEKVHFKDPKGKFIISVLSDWVLNSDKKALDKELYQFMISEVSTFQISCNKLNDEQVSRIVHANNLIPHDFDLPNLSFNEKYFISEGTTIYDWMCFIDGHLLHATLLFDEEDNYEDLGLKLMEIRMSLKNLIFLKSSTQNKADKTEVTQSEEKDYYDIINWRNSPEKFFDYMVKRDERKDINRLSPIDLDVVKLFALLKSKVSHKPNGLFDLLKTRKPLDNMIWWDFVLECDKGFIQVWRTPYVLEAMYNFEGDFDLLLFFEKNIQKYSKDISNTFKYFEKHTLFINHYKSYDECVNVLERN